MYIEYTWLNHGMAAVDTEATELLLVTNLSVSPSTILTQSHSDPYQHHTHTTQITGIACLQLI